MDRSVALIRLLADGELHSGEAIARHLGLTRAAVWKALGKASERFGLELEAVRGQGYRLRQPLELLDEGALLESLDAAARGRIARLELHPEIDSTNSHLMREAARGAPSGLVALAERQSAGRGRRGREWVSPFGVNLYLSMLWRYPLAPAALGGASLAVGAVVAEVLSAAGAEGIALKWPNDLLWRRRKLAGLLLEVAGESQGPSHLVVGLGLNLDMAQAQGKTIDQPWCALTETGARIGRNALAAHLIAALGEALELYGRRGLEPFVERWAHFDALRGEPVRLLLGERCIEGVHAGIASDGALLLDTAEGRRAFQAGEVSLRSLG